MGDYTAANLLSSRFGTGDTTGTDFEGLPDLRPSYDSFFSADSDAPRHGGRQKAVQLNGAMTALKVLREVPLEAPGDPLSTDVRSSARRSPKVALEWEELPAGQASVRRPPSLRGQVVKTQQAVSHAIEGIIRSLEDGSITEEPAGISRDEELPQEAEVKMLRAERASLQQQLQSLTEELEAAQVKVKDTEDQSARSEGLPVGEANDASGVQEGNQQNEPSTIPEDAGEVQRSEGADDDEVGDQVPLSPGSKTRDDAESEEDMPPSNASDVSVSEEEPLDAELEKADAQAAEAFLPGVYVTRSRCKVLRSVDVVNPSVGDIIKEFKAGTFVNVMSFKLLAERRLLRACLAQPVDGWIDAKDFKSQENLLDLPQASSQVEYHPRRHDGTDDPKDFAPLHERK